MGHMNSRVAAILVGLLPGGLVAGTAPRGDPPPPPAGARVTLTAGRSRFLPGRDEFLLGEDIAIRYRVENAGQGPLHYEKGAFFPDYRWNDGYSVAAVPIDEGGRVTGGPLEPANFVDESEARTGPQGAWTLAPGEAYEDTLHLPASIRMDRQGRYRVRISNHDRFAPDRELSAGEVVLFFGEPTPEQARALFEAKKALPRGPKATEAMDFRALIHPVYLPLLLEKGKEGDRDALIGLGAMRDFKSTEALIEVIRHSLRYESLELALSSFGELRERLPDPRLQETKDYPPDARRLKLIERTWRPEFAGTARELARHIARDPRPIGLDETADIYRCVGIAEDLPDLCAAYAKSIERTKTLPFETQQYFRPRGSAYGFRFATMALLGRGAAAPAEPRTPGEMAVYMIALKTHGEFRPKDWPEQVERWLKMDPPYIREMVLDYMPEPVPEGALALLPGLLGNEYVDLQIAACRVAEKHPRDLFRAPLARILEKGSEEHLLDAVTKAAPPNGVPKDAVLEILIGRIGDLHGRAVEKLLGAVVEGDVARLEPDLSTEAGNAAAARWRRFIEENREKLRKGVRFRLGDPEITADLFPKGFQYYHDGKPWPEDNF
jgi:hypothetical protein